MQIHDLGMPMLGRIKVGLAIVVLIMMQGCDFKPPDVKTMLERGDYEYVDKGPSWSPDGKYIAFLDWETPFDAPGEGHRQVYVMDQDGHNVRQLTRDPTNKADIAWSPSGQEIAFRSEDIYTVNVNDLRLTRLTRFWEVREYTAYPVWSPDASRIVFNYYPHEHDKQGLYVLELNEGALRPLAFKLLGQSSWSPDGKKLVIGNGALIVLELDTLRTTRLARKTITGEGHTEPSWSPDGKKIAFNRNGKICVMNADGSKPVQLIGGWGTEDFPTWSPDGSKIAFRDRSDKCKGLATVGSDGKGLNCLQMPDFKGEPVSGRAPLQVSFTDLSKGATAFLWSFGDGITSTLQNPVHIYQKPGKYAVELRTQGAHAKARKGYVTVSP